MSRTLAAKTYLLIALALTVASLGLAGCGSSDEDSSNDAPVVNIAAVEGSELAYTTDSVEAAAGDVTVNFTNPQATPHTVDIRDANGDLLKGKPVTEGTNTERVVLKPGTYTFYCSFPGHQEAGMEGTLTVK